MMRVSSEKEVLLYGNVCAGFPSPAENYLEAPLNIHDHLVVNTSATFLLRVAGDSMVNAAIVEGDIIVVDRSLTPQSGQVVVACVNQEFTLKRYVRCRGKVCLRAENKSYPEIVFEEGSEVVIWGVVVGVARKLL